MFERITLISDRGVHIKLLDATSAANLMNMHLVLEDNGKTILGEVEYVHDDIIEVRFIGEIIDGIFYGGVINKPGVASKIRLMNDNEIELITNNVKNIKVDVKNVRKNRSKEIRRK